MNKIKMICIKELFNGKRLWYKEGDFYDYDGLSVFFMFKIFDFNDGLALSDSMIMSREELYKHFMPYNEWLALQREEQIKSVLDD